MKKIAKKKNGAREQTNKGTTEQKQINKGTREQGNKGTPGIYNKDSTEENTQ